MGDFGAGVAFTIYLSLSCLPYFLSQTTRKLCDERLYMLLALNPAVRSAASWLSFALFQSARLIANRRTDEVHD